MREKGEDAASHMNSRSRINEILVQLECGDEIDARACHWIVVVFSKGVTFCLNLLIWSTISFLKIKIIKINEKLIAFYMLLIKPAL